MFIGILPLGVLAAINAYLVDVKYFVGDYAGAQSASDEAHRWSVLSIIIALPILIAIIIALC